MCLGDDAAVNDTVDSMLQEDVKGKLIVDCSTVHPDTTNALEKRITEKGAEFVGMPGTSQVWIVNMSVVTNMVCTSIRRPGHGRQWTACLCDCRTEGSM